jgi:hypothetical protein
MPTSEPAPTLALDRLFLRTAAEAVQYLAAVPGMPREDLMRIARTLCGAGEEIERLRARVAELEAGNAGMKVEIQRLWAVGVMVWPVMIPSGSYPAGPFIAHAVSDGGGPPP